MQPEDPLTPNVTPSTPPSPIPSAPIFNPPPIQQPTAVPTSPLPRQPSGPITQADFLALENKPKRRRRIAVLAASLTTLIIIGTTVLLSGVLAPNKLTRTTYNNGGGSKYSMLFYDKHHNVDSGGNKLAPMALAGLHGKDGKAPLKISISDKQLTDATKNGGANEHCGSVTPIATVRNEYAKKDVNICDFYNNTNSKDLIYLAVFRAHDRIFIAIINQDIDVNESLSSPSEARRALARTDLSTYKEDISKIVASIRPAQ